jgi:hypothetical protein
LTFGVRRRDHHQPGTTRRVLLITGLAGGVASLAGCRGSDDSGAGGSRAHPLQPTLAGALALVGRYDATIAAQPNLSGRLAPLRADHATHVEALNAAMGRATPSAIPSAGASGSPGPAVPTDTKAAVAALRAAEKTAQGDAAKTCISVPAQYAELLGSIAACRATHLEVLT